MWEIYTLGTLPYPAVRDADIEEYIVEKRKRLALPESLEDEQHM